MEIRDNTTIADFVHFHQKVLVLLFKVRNADVSADESECIKIKSSNECLNFYAYRIQWLCGTCFLVRFRTLQPTLISHIYIRLLSCVIYNFKTLPSAEMDKLKFKTV